MSDPVVIATGPCYIHGGLFSFDPVRVQTVWIDPVTGRPPDVDEDGAKLPDDDPVVVAGMGRAVQRFLCPDCCRALNFEAHRRGLPRHFDETDTSSGQVQR